MTIDHLLDSFIPRFSVVESTIKELKIDSSTYSSLMYYAREVRERIRSNLESDDARAQLQSLVNVLLCSLYNHMCYLAETSRHVDETAPNIVVFEACPNDVRKIKTREEALSIKMCAIKYGFNPILRFGTNIKVFKEVCNNIRLDYVRFAGHGEGNGDLAFVGHGGGSRFMGYSTFEKYFSGEYLRHHSRAKVKNIYLNSCYSDKFARKICASKSIGSLFEHSISHNEDNPDELALESSSFFYEKMMPSKSIEDGFYDTRDRFMASLSSDKNEYGNAMVLM